jgi:hypothetical protein
MNRITENALGLLAIALIVVGLTLNAQPKPAAVSAVSDALTGREAAKETSPYIVVRFDVGSNETATSSFERQLRTYIRDHPNDRIVSLTPVSSGAFGQTTSVVGVFSLR